MRNWNFHTRKKKLLFLESFYSTYEELKLLDEKPFVPKRDRFYSTYEELKHVRSDGLIVALKSFYSTYEELKQHQSIFFFLH